MNKEMDGGNERREINRTGGPRRAKSEQGTSLTLKGTQNAACCTGFSGYVAHWSIAPRSACKFEGLEAGSGFFRLFLRAPWRAFAVAEGGAGAL